MLPGGRGEGQEGALTCPRKDGIRDKQDLEDREVAGHEGEDVNVGGDNQLQFSLVFSEISIKIRVESHIILQFT